MDWINIVQTVGFPIAMVLAYSYFIYQQYLDSKEREKTYVELIQEQNKRFDAQDLQLQAIVLTQEKIIERLEKMEGKENTDE